MIVRAPPSPRQETKLSGIYPLCANFPLERNLVVQVAPLRRIPRRPTAGRASGRTSRGTFPRTGAFTRTAALAASAGIEHGEFTLETADHHLSGIAFLPLLIGPFPRLQCTLDI